jgi:hypothetical protein
MTEQLRVAIEEIDIEITNAPSAQIKLLLLAMRKRIMDRVCEAVPGDIFAQIGEEYRDYALAQYHQVCQKLRINTLSTDTGDTLLEAVCRLKSELARWRELPAKIEGLMPQTNIPLSAAVVRTTALNQVLDLIAAAKGGES